MTDREALAAALAYLTKEFGPSAEWPEGDPEWVEYRPLVAAARELLTGQKVWWCVEHGDTGAEDRCLWKPLGDDCRMVEAVLVIPDEKGEK